MSEEKQTRSHQVTIRLEPKIYEALIEISDRVGIKPASVAGLAIGDYVTKAQATYGAAGLMNQLMAKEMSTLMFEHVKPMLTEDQLKHFVEENLND
jgi:hypothetical protein